MVGAAETTPFQRDMINDFPVLVRHRRYTAVPFVSASPPRASHLRVVQTGTYSLPSANIGQELRSSMPSFFVQ